jgi:xylulokinase
MRRSDSERPIYVGIDVGTSSVKVVAVDEAGVLVRAESASYPTELGGTSAEQDPHLWWQAITRVCASVVEGRPVAAVAVTSQAPTLVRVDREGEAVGNALTWLDRRAGQEAKELASLLPPDREDANPFFGTAKLLWWARHDSVPHTHVLTANGYVVLKLTGARTLDESSASLLQGFDDTTGRLSERLQQAVDLRALPPVVPCDALVGRVSAAAAEATGIPAGTWVAAGAIDAIGTALEAGALAAGSTLVEMTGFSTVAMLPVSRGHHPRGFIRARHVVPDTDLLIAAQVSTGAVVDWLRRLVPHELNLLDSVPLLARPRPSPLTVVPSFAGERTPTWNADARGIVAGISLETDARDILIGVMEGVALAFDAEVRRLREAGFPVELVRSTGGGARSDAWLQIKSDVLGLPVERPSAGQGAAQGAAYLAALAVGDLGYRDLANLGAASEKRFWPDETKRSRYLTRKVAYGRLASLNEERFN